jgi:hypothetical protein
MDHFIFSVHDQLAPYHSFLIFQPHLLTYMMLTHLPSSMMNSRCEKDEVREKWSGR